jgi:hypothetical protein
MMKSAGIGGSYRLPLLAAQLASQSEFALN